VSINQKLISLSFLSLLASNPAPAQQSADSNQGDIESYRATLDRYCITCHNEALKTSNLILDEDHADIAELGKDPALWEKLLLKLQTRSMPPVGMPRPDDSFYQSMSEFLETGLATLAENDPDPGRTVTAHRLNRTEYTNVIRDLLGVFIDGAALLPPDNSGGFDNLGDLLSISPLLTEKYIAVANEVSRLAIGDMAYGATSQVYTVSPFILQNERMNEDLPFGTRGGLAVNHRFPLDGEYEISIRLQRTDDTGLVVGMNRPHQLDFLVDGKRIDLLSVGGENVGLALGPKTDDGIPPEFEQAQYERTADAHLKIRFNAKAGEHLVQVAFLDETFAWEDQVPPRNLVSYNTARLEKNKDYERAWMNPSVSSIIVSGPFEVKGPGNTISRGKIFVCTPKRKVDEEPCAIQILSKLVRQAFRRPVTESDIEPYLGLYRQGLSETGDFDAGIQMALEGLLVSSEFLFRIYRDPVDLPENSVYPLSEFDLASRLSFFLWSSIPDDELLDLAELGKLGDPLVLEQQVKRMLKDKRSEPLVNNFAEQWLLLRNLPHTNKNQELFPEFDEDLRNDLQTETQLFLASIFLEDRSILDLFRANYKYVNERLARLYEIPDVYGNRFRKVKIDDPNKMGLLAQGAVLAITSYPNRTSPVLRGKWVLENIIAAPPPPPPDNIPALKEKDEGGKTFTMREAMEKHRANPVCAVCHNRMDPIGFGLENFSPIGKWRIEDAGQPIDSSGMMPDGTLFQGPAQLQNALLANPEVIANAFTSKLMTYALGRDLEYYDMPNVRNIVQASAHNEYRFSDLVTGIVKSLPFKMRKTGS
jgi:hypothetical protein